MTSARICQHCGHSLTPNDRFCPQCGTGQIAAPAPAAPTSGPWDGILDRLARAVAPRYRVIRLIGHGGMAGVYLADEPRLGRRVALKVMAPGLMIDPALVTRFEQEARTTAQLNHPNIVTIYDVDTRDDLHFFVMAYVPGRTLGQITVQAAEPLAVRAVLHWFAQAGSGLAYAHRMGIVHRDIKPANIMVDGFGNALVTDFGIAKVADEPSLTRTGFLVGTPTYMSPEQCAAATVTGASDQYSMGIVLYEMLTGKPPFSGATVSVLQAHVGQTPAPVRELRPDCPPALAEAIDRMLLKAPADRFPTVAAAVSAAGATVLGDDDPLRDRLGTLAAVADAVELPPVGALTPGEATALPAKVVDAQGRPLPGRQIRWASDTPALLSVNEEGVVYALAPGTARVTAWCDGVVATTLLEITPAPGPLTRLADVSAVETPIGVTELFTPTPLPAPPEPAPPPPQTSAPAAEPATPAPISETVTPVPEPVAFAPAAASLPAAPDNAPTEEPQLPVAAEPDLASAHHAGDGAVLTGPVDAPDLIRPRPREGGGKRSSRMPVLAGIAVLAIALVTAVTLIDFGGSADADDPPIDPPAAGPPDDGGQTTGQVQPPPTGGIVSDSGAPGIAAADTADDTSESPERETSEPENQAEQPPTRQVTPPPAPPPAEPRPPANGTLRIASTLPAGARVTLSGPGARDGMVWEDGIALAPGSYAVQVSAPDYVTFRGTVTIRAGEPSTISPRLEAEAPATPAQPPAATPDAGGAAAEEAVRGVIAGFVNALASRDLDAVSRQYPGAGGAWRATWSPLIENRDVRDLVPQLGGIRDVEVAGDVATAVFTLVLQYNDMNTGRQAPSFDFSATMRRSDNGWILSELRQVQR